MRLNYTKRKGSRPPPSKRPQTSGLSIFFIMGLVIAAALLSSGGGNPVDPNGPGGPPTLEPYFERSDYPQQDIVLPKDPQTKGDKNLQLKTFNVSHCGENSAMIFLIDTSGSMKFANKMENTKDALRYFVDQLGGKSVIGIYTFSKDVDEEVPISYYKDVKKDVAEAIDDMKPGGHTRTRDGMALVRTELRKVIDEKAYPGYKYSLILMTDGVPEIPPPEPRDCYVRYPDPNTAPAERCFAKAQDPRIPNDISKEIKDRGTDIYSVNIYSPSYASDAFMFPYLEGLLKEVASTPTESHYYSSINAGNLKKILETVVQDICVNN